MNPGEEGGTEPLTFFFFRRRSKKQQAKKSAAAPRRPKGTPSPRPIFWPLVRPVSLTGGESSVGSDDGLVGGFAMLVGVVVEEERFVLESDGVLVEDVEVDRFEESNVVGVMDAVDSGPCVLAVNVIVVIVVVVVPAVSSPVLEGCAALVSSWPSVVVVAVGHAHSAVLVGGSVGHAV
jgi:hypothetical protein